MTALDSIESLLAAIDDSAKAVRFNIKFDAEGMMAMQTLYQTLVLGNIAKSLERIANTMEKSE